MPVERGKVVILGGTPRTGKTTLAVKLAHHGFSKLSFDALSQAIQRGLPEVAVEDWTSQAQCAAKLFPFFASLVESAIADTERDGVSTVIDMYDYTPECVSRLARQDGFSAYYLAYPGRSVREIRHAIRHWARPDDWIAQVDEDYLDVVAQRCAALNQTLAGQCARYGYPLVDTGLGNSARCGWRRCSARLRTGGNRHTSDEGEITCIWPTNGRTMR